MGGGGRMRPDERPHGGIAAFGLVAIVVGGIALLALWRVEPSLRWAWRHQQPWWVIGLAGLWIAGGIVLIVARRRAVAAAATLAVLAVSAPLALGTAIDISNQAYIFSDYRFWWLGDRWGLSWIDLASVVAAFLAGWILGRLPPAPGHRWPARIGAVLLGLLALALTAIAVVAFAIIGIAGEEHTQIPLYVRHLFIAQAALAVAGAALAYAFARRS